MTNESDGTIPINGDDPVLWNRVRHELSIGKSVLGTVICRRPFGLFLDIGYGTGACAMLLVPDFKDVKNRRIEFGDFPQVGEAVAAWVINVDFEHRKIALTQHPQRLITDNRGVNAKQD